MDSINDFNNSATKRAVRVRYEVSRTTRAILAALPLVVVMLLSGFVTERWGPTIEASFCLGVVATGLLWYGQDLGRGVLPGAFAGIVPFSLSAGAGMLGHVCVGNVCTSLCAPACIVGGLLAGGSIAWYAFRRKRGLLFLVAAACMAVLIGSMGCGCIGFSSVGGLVLGTGLGLLPALIQARRIRNQ